MPDVDVPYIFKGSLAYVLPSLYEGFGIPPIEAMATGVPVVVSKVGSLPEVCGDSPVYIDNPYAINSIQQALSAVTKQTPSEREKKIKIGLQWVKRYNWKETAKQTLAVLKNV
jgi:glycosyltransferase involved in cell wall biosynthesis